MITNIWYHVGRASDVHFYKKLDQYNQCANITDHMTYTKKHQIVARLFNGDVSNLVSVLCHKALFLYTTTHKLKVTVGRQNIKMFWRITAAVAAPPPVVLAVASNTNAKNLWNYEDKIIEIWLISFDYLIIYFSFLTAIEVKHHIVRIIFYLIWEGPMLQ